MHVPSDEVTTVRPSELEVDVLVEPVPGPTCVVTEGPAPVVEPDTLPPPAVTELLMLPAEEDDEVFGGVSPGFKCTVLQLLLLGPAVDVVLPSDESNSNVVT